MINAIGNLAHQAVIAPSYGAITPIIGAIGVVGACVLLILRDVTAIRSDGRRNHSSSNVLPFLQHHHSPALAGMEAPRYIGKRRVIPLTVITGIFLAFAVVAIVMRFATQVLGLGA
ncbi:MAG: hypothetical protein ACRDFX_12020 [Chloroflexota bacterium]